MLIGSSWLDGDAIWRYFFSPRKCSRQFRRVFFSSTNPLPNPTIYDKDTNLNAFEAASSKVWCRMCTRGFSQMAKWLKISVILGGLFCFFFFASGPNQGRQRANVLLLSISNGPENKWNEIVKKSSLYEREALFGRAQADLGPCRWSQWTVWTFGRLVFKFTNGMRTLIKRAAVGIKKNQ